MFASVDASGVVRAYVAPRVLLCPGSVAQLAEAADSKPARCRFESCRSYSSGPVAQLAVHRALNAVVAGSNPAGAA